MARRPAARSASAAELDPDAYYQVEAQERFTFRRVEFGAPFAKPQISGAFLAELLAATGLPAVTYTRVGA